MLMIISLFFRRDVYYNNITKKKQYIHECSFLQQRLYIFNVHFNSGYVVNVHFNSGYIYSMFISTAAAIYSMFISTAVM